MIWEMNLFETTSLHISWNFRWVLFLFTWKINVIWPRIYFRNSIKVLIINFVGYELLCLIEIWSIMALIIITIITNIITMNIMLFVIIHIIIMIIFVMNILNLEIMLDISNTFIIIIIYIITIFFISINIIYSTLLNILFIKKSL